MLVLPSRVFKLDLRMINSFDKVSLCPLPGEMGPVGVLVNVFWHWWEGFAVNGGIICRKFAGNVVIICCMDWGGEICGFGWSR